MQFTVHLNTKNALFILVGAVVLALAIIPLLVEGSDLQKGHWQTIVVALALAGLVAWAVQGCLQSRDDHERDERDRNIQAALAKMSVAPLKVETTLPSPSATTNEDAGLYIELYEPLFVYPKAGDLAFQLMKAKYLAEGKPEHPTTNCDVLVELYIVNRRTNSSYIRDFCAFMQIDGEWRKLSPDVNFHLDDLWSGSVEYGLNAGNGGEWRQEPAPLTNLITKRNAEIQTGQPLEGWLKFSVADINPELKYQFRMVVIDTLGKEHYLDKAVPKSRRIALRRVGS